VEVLEQANLKEVDEFVNTYLVGQDAVDCVLKPTHLSNANGVLSLSAVPPHEHEQAVSFVTQHMQEYMCRKAGVHESMAMRSLHPGFIGQPKYKSVVGFETPLELRVIVLWGKARLAVWWWGRSDSPGEQPNRNAWLVRRPRVVGEISNDDDWQVIHNHLGHNPGFDKALELFERHISAMAVTAEAVAGAFGAPFLRIDFFVGNPRWGIRLNEVAYGCGCDYRNITEDGIVYNDAQAVAQIIAEGMRVSRQSYPPEHFLAKLGMFGPTYGQSSISKLKKSLRPPLPAGALDEDSELLSSRDCWDCRVPDHLCKTMRDTRDDGRVAYQCHRATSGTNAGRSSPIVGSGRAASPNVRSMARAVSPNVRHLGSASCQAPSPNLRGCHRALSPNLGHCRRPASPEPEFGHYRRTSSPSLGRCRLVSSMRGPGQPQNVGAVVYPVIHAARHAYILY